MDTIIIHYDENGLGEPGGTLAKEVKFWTKRGYATEIAPPHINQDGMAYYARFPWEK